MLKSFAISSTGFKGGARAGAKADFRPSIRYLNVAIVPSLLNVSCSVERGPPALGFLAAGGADIVRNGYTTQEGPSGFY